MNIIQVGSYPLSADCIHGGVESSVYGLTQALVRAGHTVDVFDNPRIGGKDTCERKGLLTIHRYANTGRHNEDAMQRCKEIFRDIVALHPEIIHIHGTGKLSGTIYEAAQNYGIPVVLTVHGLLHEEKKQALRRKFSLKHLYQYIVQTRSEMDVLNRASRIIVDTPYVERMLTQYRQKGKLTQLPEIHVIPQGISAVYYGLSCAEEGNTILSVGSISPRKGHLYTVKIFNTLRDRGIYAKLRILGSLADSNYYDKLTKTIQKSPYCTDITLETNVSQEDVFMAYKSAKLFVLHSQEESQGIVFAEAMATGMPVVATKVGGIPDVVENGKVGFLCEFGDTLSMAECVEQILTDEKMWHTFSQCAREVAQIYDWDKIADQISILYKEVKLCSNTQNA